MKRFLSLLLLLTPLISLSMDKGGQSGVRRDNAKKPAATTLPAREETDLGVAAVQRIADNTKAMLDEFGKEAVATNDKKATFMGKEERAGFIKRLSDMRYFDLMKPELREAYISVIQLAKLEQEQLKKDCKDSAEYVQWSVGGQVIHLAQIKLADTLAMLCPNDSFMKHVKTVCGLIDIREKTSSTDAVDADCFSALSKILKNYDALTETSYSDLSEKADEPLAKRLAEKLVALSLEKK